MVIQCEGYDRTRDPLNPPRCTCPAVVRLTVFSAPGAPPDDTMMLCDECAGGCRARLTERGGLVIVEERLPCAQARTSEAA